MKPQRRVAVVATNELIRLKIEELERKYDKHDKDIQDILEAMRELVEPPKSRRKKPIGFHVKY